MSINWLIDVDPVPAILVLPPAAASLDEAHAAIELWEHYSHKTLDPTQRLMVEVMMAQRSDGRWAAATTGREMPRQNGKGDEVEVVELWGLLQRGEAIMHTVHDAILLASQTQQRMLGVLEGHPDLRRKKLRQWMGTGQQMIEMRNGGVIWYRTRTGGGGRGVDDIDRLVVDEAQHATEEHLGAVSPTLFVNPNPQMNVLGTAGIAGKSAWWWTMRRRALGPDPGDFGYVGHTAESVSLNGAGVPVQGEIDVEDRGLWPRANPALWTGRGQGLPYFEEQLRRLGRESFAREHLCVWDPEPGAIGGAIAIERWDSCLDPESRIEGPRVFAFDVTPGATQACIAACGRRADGKPHVEVVAYERGSRWLPERLRELVDKWKPSRVLCDPTGPAGSLLPDLSGVEVSEVTVREHAHACGALLTAVEDEQVRHIGQLPLRAAVLGAGRRDVGDVWLWSRAASSVDISPLVAVTLAAWGAMPPAPADRKVFAAWR